jgi:putative protease
VSAELLSPAGDTDCALAAFAAGADAVYCGLADFSARAFAKNFSPSELRDIVAYAHARDRKVYVTFNTLVDERDLPRAADALAELADIGPDALILHDLGIAAVCREKFPELPIHASTQLVAHNLEGVLALKRLGFSRVVLARELSIAEIASIAKRCGGTELECFIHGALCYSVSGLCLFSAMEKGRSGNKGRCAYCCRERFEGPDGKPGFPFSMKDLRAGEDARRLAEAGVASLKIEGRMKSPLYVASVTAHYRAILDGAPTPPGASTEDLATVFSRRTTPLYLDGPADGVVDVASVGHLGAPVGTVKRVTADREGRRWLRFHTLRALERHDGLQFAAPGGGRPFGFGISEMRKAISRGNVFEAGAGSDVEILLPEDVEIPPDAIRPGDTVYCSMSNAVKRSFKIPSLRPGSLPGTVSAKVSLALSRDCAKASVSAGGCEIEVSAKGDFAKAEHPDATFAAAGKAFSKTGGTPYSLDGLSLADPDGVFVPMGVMNELRREAWKRLDEARDRLRMRRAAAAGEPAASAGSVRPAPPLSLKIREGQKIPEGDWNEIVVAVSSGTVPETLAASGAPASSRLALPVYTPEPAFNKLRIAVKRLLRAGYAKWEASDLATLSMLKECGVEDVTADWTLNAFNTRALSLLSSLGVSATVASPENPPENLRALAESGFAVEFLTQQCTPLFVSATKPAFEPSRSSGLAVYPRDGLWITVRALPRVFDPPDGAPRRLDLSWSPPC